MPAVNNTNMDNQENRAVTPFYKHFNLFLFCKLLF